MKRVIKISLTVLVVLLPQIISAKQSPTDSSMVSLLDSNLTFYLNEYDFSDSAERNWIKGEEITPEQFINSNEIWARIPIPVKEYKNPAILLIGNYSNLEVYLDSALVFKRIYVDKKEYLNMTKNIIPLENLAATENILLRLKYGKWYNVGGFSTLLLGEVSKLLEYSAKRDLDELPSFALNVAVGAILFIMSLLAFFFYIKRRNLKYYPFINFALISFFAGLDHFIETTLVFIIPVPLIWIAYSQVISVLVIPIALTILINQIFGPGWKSLFKNFWKFHSSISITYILITLYDVEYTFILPDLDILIILEILIFILVFFKSGFHKEKDSKYIFYAVFIFLLFALNDLLGNIGILPWKIELYGLGIIVISLSLINLLMNNYGERVLEAKNYETKIKEKELELIKLKKESLQSQYDALKSQVNPHFLFNTFSTLMTVIQENQDNGIQFVQKLSNVYRYVLQSKDHELIKLEEELNFINAYKYLLDKRFNEGLIFTINIPDEFKTFSIIPLSLQLLIENCIKHNIVSEKKPLTIEVFVDDNNILIVKNNLQLKSIFEYSTKIGLENIKNRYKLLAGKDIIVVKTKDYFEVKIPLIKIINENESSNS